MNKIRSMMQCFFLFCSINVMADEYIHSQTSTTFPEYLLNIPLIKVNEFKDSNPECELGTAIIYKNSKVTVTLYLYRFSELDIPDGSISDVVMNHFESMAEELSMMHNQESSSSWARSSVLLGQHDALKMKFVLLNSDGKYCDSFLYVTGYKSHYFKIRVTYDGAEDRSFTARLENRVGKILSAKAVKFVATPNY